MSVEIWSVFDFDLPYPGVMFTGEHAKDSAEAYAEVRRAQNHQEVFVGELRTLDVLPEDAAYSKTVYEIETQYLLTEEEILLRKIFGEPPFGNSPQEPLEREIDVYNQHPLFGLAQEITEPVHAYTLPNDEILLIGLDRDAVLDAARALPEGEDGYHPSREGFRKA